MFLTLVVQFAAPATGSYQGDKAALYGKAELKDSFDRKKWEAHHVSYDPNTNTMTMQLVETSKHRTKHEGGVKDFETYHNLEKGSYGNDNAREAAKRQESLCHQ
jgi:hypothetical protein